MLEGLYKILMQIDGVYNLKQGFLNKFIFLEPSRLINR